MCTTRSEDYHKMHHNIEDLIHSQTLIKFAFKSNLYQNMALIHGI